MPCGQLVMAETKNKCSQTGIVLGQAKTHCLVKEIRAGQVNLALEFTYFKHMFFIIFPHMDYILIFAHKLCITTIWECVLNS